MKFGTIKYIKTYKILQNAELIIYYVSIKYKKI